MTLAALVTPPARVRHHVCSGHDQESLRNDLRARIAAYKIPKHIEFPAALPRTTSGKILRRALRERMAQPVTAGALSLHADRPSHLRRP
jgi:acyl-coenzyme A synthetase/AMP-(fatty) acid ligase